jgi:hypothetical protein
MQVLSGSRFVIERDVCCVCCPDLLQTSNESRLDLVYLLSDLDKNGIIQRVSTIFCILKLK